MVNYDTVKEVRESIERVGGLEKVREDLVKKCYEKLKKIEEIALEEGRGTSLGGTNLDYLDFLNYINPFLLKEQLSELTQRYDEIKKGFPKPKKDLRTYANVQKCQTK